MRIEKLRLLAFGPFSDLTLDFGEAVPALHLIYGKNEAGKSTTLRAIGDLLYGIPHESRDVHRHAGKDLRIGATLVRSDGKRIECIRRKGRKNTLLSPSGTPLEEGALDEFTAGIDRALFSISFGLDHESLRSGAQSMLEGHGEVGRSLFGAAVGGRGIKRVLDSLSEEAERLFSPRGRTKIIHQGIAELRDARRRVEELSTSARIFVAQKEAVAAAAEERDRLRARRSELMAEQSRLQRILRVLPDLGRRREILERVSLLGSVPDLPADARDLRIDAVARRAAAAHELSRIDADIDETDAARRAVVFPEALLGVDENVIRQIRERLGRHQAAAVDLPKRRGELSGIEADMAAIVQRLGRDVAVEDIDSLRAGVAAAARVRALASRKDRLVAEVEHAERTLAQATRQRDRLSAGLAELIEPSEESRLRASLEAAERDGDLDERRLAAEEALGELEASVARRVEALGLSSPRVDLADLPVPSAETVEQFERRWVTSEADERRFQSILRDLASQRREVERQLEELESQGDVPTEVQLDALRAERDARWAGLRSEIANGTRADEDDLTGYEAASIAVDRMADRLRREAHRVAQHGNLMARRRYLTEEEAAASDELAALSRARTGMEAAWREAWIACGVVPRPPAEMRAWRARFDAALGGVVELGRAEREARTLAQRAAQRKGDLASALREHGVELDDGAGWSAAVAAARRTLVLVEATRRERASSNAALADLERQIEEIGHELAGRRRDLAAWQTAWNDVLGSLGLSNGATEPEEALAVLDVLGDLLRRSDDARRVRRRIEGMERDSGELDREVRSLVGRYLPEVTGASLAEAAQALLDGYEKARAGAQERERLGERLSELHRRRDALLEAIAGADRSIDGLLRAAGADSLDALEAIERRSAEMTALRAALAEVDDKVLAAGGGSGIEALIGETAGVDADRAAARLVEIESELDEAQEALEMAAQQVVKQQSGLEFLGAGAADAALELSQVVAPLRDHVERYVRLRLATIVLEREIERYRRDNQGPILSRASELFTRLTLERYRGLSVGFDEKDAASIRAVRADETEVGIEGLSDGTRDQLYLALRLATLERHAQKDEPMPLVLDDVLIHFDDDRACAALAVLGDFAERSQVLFFTHHERLRELGRRALPASKLVELSLPDAE